MNKTYIFTISALVIGISILYASTTVSAFGMHGGQDTLIQRLSQKLGKSEEDVKAVFDEIHQERQKEMQANLEERLTQAVTDGKITKAQKQAILQKHQELQAQHQQMYETMQNLTPQERKAELEKKRSEIEAWATENGIDLQYLHMGIGKMGKGFGPGHQR